MTDLATVQACIPFYYRNHFIWSQKGTIIKAQPHGHISEACFQFVKKVFKQFGGAYVRRDGSAYFELVLELENNRSLRQPPKLSCTITDGAVASDKSVFNQLQTNINKLVRAGEELEEDAKT